jgi:hypothetical protein
MLRAPRQKPPCALKRPFLGLIRRGPDSKFLSLIPLIPIPQDSEPEEQECAYTFFVYRPRWFVLSQTEGEDVEPEPIPGWEKEQALRELGITEERFEDPNGNVQGYSVPGGKIAISPLAQLPSKTLFHELAHQLLGHVGDQTIIEEDRLPKNLREAEAESVALICCEALGLDGASYCRSYIQSWLAGDEIPEKSAQRIFAAADRILRAGTTVAPQPAS